MVAFPAIDSGAHGYALIFTHGITDCWRGWLVAYNVQQLLTNFVYYLVLRNQWKDLS